MKDLQIKPTKKIWKYLNNQNGLQLKSNKNFRKKAIFRVKIFFIMQTNFLQINFVKGIENDVERIKKTKYAKISRKFFASFFSFAKLKQKMLV